MTAEEQKTYDEIMKRGREVADAVKSHHHDQEVWAFAKSKDHTDAVLKPPVDQQRRGGPISVATQT